MRKLTADTINGIWEVESFSLNDDYDENLIPMDESVFLATLKEDFEDTICGTVSEETFLRLKEEFGITTLEDY